MRSNNRNQIYRTIAEDEHRLKALRTFNRLLNDRGLFHRHLDHPHTGIRQSAVEALGQVRDRSDATVTALIEALEDQETRVRREAAMALAPCGDRRAVPPLIESLGDADWGVRRAAHGSLVWLTAADLPFDADGGTDQRRQQQAAWRDWWQQQGASWTTELIGRLQGEASPQVTAAIRALGRLEATEARSAIRPWLADGTVWTGKVAYHWPRPVAAEALGEIGDPASVPALRDTLVHESITFYSETDDAPRLAWAQTESAAYGLGMIGNREAAAALIDLLLRTPQFKKKGLSGGALDDLFKNVARKELMRCDPQEVIAAYRAAFGSADGSRKARSVYQPASLGADDLWTFEPRDRARSAYWLARLVGHGLEDFEDLGIGSFMATSKSMQRTLERYVDKILKDPHKDGKGTVVFANAQGLGLLGDPSVAPALRDYLARLPAAGAQGLRNKAYLQRSGWKYGDTVPDEYPGVQPRPKAALCMALGYLEDAEAVAVIGPILLDPQHAIDTRYAAAVALEWIGDEAAIPWLERCLDEEVMFVVRRAAQEAIDRITGAKPFASVYSDFPGFREHWIAGPDPSTAALQRGE